MPETQQSSAPTEQAEERQRLHRRRDFALILTNVSKVVGLVAGVAEAASAHPNKASLIFYGVLVFGVQKVENIIVNTIDRILGGK